MFARAKIARSIRHIHLAVDDLLPAQLCITTVVAALLDRKHQIWAPRGAFGKRAPLDGVTLSNMAIDYCAPHSEGEKRSSLSANLIVIYFWAISNTGITLAQPYLCSHCTLSMLSLFIDARKTSIRQLQRAIKPTLPKLRKPLFSKYELCLWCSRAYVCIYFRLFYCQMSVWLNNTARVTPQRALLKQASFCMQRNTTN